MAETKKETPKKEEAPKKTFKEHLNEKVTVRLFKDNERYKDDVFVAVNGKTWQIKRGYEVQIPRYVAMVLDESLKQDAATAEMIDRESGKFDAESKRLGL